MRHVARLCGIFNDLKDVPDILLRKGKVRFQNGVWTDPSSLLAPLRQECPGLVCGRHLV